ncbi:hypothetical protein BDAP_002575 [Binucleata daphniae]
MVNSYIGINDYESFLDKRVTVLLWDGSYFFGKLRSFDQFNSITLENCDHRIYYKNFYGEIKHDIMVVRGENIVLIGLKECDEKYEKVNFDTVADMIKNNV